MSDLFLLTKSQFSRIRPYFPLAHGVERVDDLQVISGIIYVIKHGLQWKDAPKEYGPHKTLYNRFIRWSRMGVFNRIFAALAGKAGTPDRLMIDATHLKAHRTTASLLKKGSFPMYWTDKRQIELEVACGCRCKGLPLVLLLTEGQVSDYKELLADRGYDADWFRNALIKRGISPCIPPRRKRKQVIEFNKQLYKQRYRIENMFGRIKDWRRMSTRYDRCSHTIFSATLIAVTCIYDLN